MHVYAYAWHGYEIYIIYNPYSLNYFYLVLYSWIGLNWRKKKEGYYTIKNCHFIILLEYMLCILAAPHNVRLKRCRIKQILNIRITMWRKTWKSIFEITYLTFEIRLLDHEFFTTKYALLKTGTTVVLPISQ